VTLLGESPEQVAEAQRDMARIGLEKPAAMATGKPDEWAGDDPLGSFSVATFKELKVALDEAARNGDDILVLDVRRPSEFDGGHIEGAVNVPIHNVLAHVDDIPRKKLWIHCAGGYRASVVASILDARGYDVVSVDDSFDENAASAGLSLTA
jgi:hydroxyacylglutathione hydrolase